MAIRRITQSDIVVGQPLPWDIFSTPYASRPLMEKGLVVGQGQLDGWLAAGGLYAETGAAASILQTLNGLNRRLELTLMALRDHGNADTELRAIARELIDCIEHEREIVLAAIFLNQIVGSYAVRHCTETAIVAALIACDMGKTREETLIITAAALTMNVGMVRQAELFQGKDSALSHEERALVRRHPVDSVDLLRWAGVRDEEWLNLVLLHHENDDGSGYPEGRLGHEISQNAKLVSLADRYCAYVSARNYRRSLLPPEALAKLCEEGEGPVDPALSGYFDHLLGAYPPGTLVRLANGETGVVSGRNDGQGGIAVHVLRGTDGMSLPEPALRSSAAPGCAIESALHEDQARLRFTMQQIWGERASL